MSENYSILPEHAGVAKETVSGGDDYSPSEAEKKEIKLGEKLFERAKKARQPHDEKWIDYYKLFRGKQWKEQRPSYRHSEVYNLIFQAIQSTVPIITDSQPKFEFLPSEPSDREFADIVNEVAEADWIKYGWLNILTEILYEGYIYGTGISCMKWDPDAEFGAGKIEYESIDPLNFYPDPSAYDVNRNCEYVVFAEPMDKSKIKRKWKNGKYVKPDLIDLVNGSKGDLGPIRFKSPTDSRTVVEGSSMADVTDKDKALVVTIYMKSDEFEEKKSQAVDPETGMVTETVESTLKFPNGKKLVFANGILLEVGPNPYEDGEFPYQRWQNYILAREFWGISECEPLEGPQKSFNKIWSFALDVMTLMGNPIWIVDTTSGVDPENLFNRPGQVVEKEPNSEVRREEGVQLQPFVMQLGDKLKEIFDQIGGSNDITRGVNPTGVTAASAIADLQNAAQTRIRQKSRNLDIYLQQVGQQYLSRVLQFYTSPRVVRITGKDGAEKYFKFHINQSEDGSRVGMVENYTEQGLSSGITEYPITGKLDVRVTTGTALPFNKAEKEQRLFGLFDRALIDQEEVLKGMDYPNYQAVMQRMQEKAEQQAMMEAQAAQPAPASAPA
jgi:hypothetical protein